MFSEFLIYVLLSLCLFRVWYRSSRPLNFPPGPIGVPILGNLLAFRKSPLRAMMKWKEEYGNIVGLNLGQFKAVLISDYSLLKEAFNNKSFNGRPDFKPALLFTGAKGQGTLTSEREPWDVIRRFTFTNLNRLGFGKKSMETMIQDDIEELILELRKDMDEPIHLHDRFYIPIANHLWHTLVGRRIPYGQHLRFKKTLLRLHRALWKPIGSCLWFTPSLTDIFPKWTGWERLVETMPCVKNLVNHEIKKHKDECQILEDDEDTKPLDLIDAYLRKIKMTTDPLSEFYDCKGENHMQSMILNVFVTASEAMNNTLNWTFLYLSLYPQVQHRLFEEIEGIVGLNRIPSLADAQKMPYARAVMDEVFRIASTSPFSNFQMTTEDVVFHGHKIPINTVVIGNLYSIHHDPIAWGDPEVFRPERFLEDKTSNSAGESKFANPPLIPFSTGLRVCPGQIFARNELFLFMTTLCQHFKFQLDPKDNVPTVDDLTDQSLVSIFRFPQSRSFILTDRSIVINNTPRDSFLTHSDLNQSLFHDMRVKMKLC